MMILPGEKINLKQIQGDLKIRVESDKWSEMFATNLLRTAAFDIRKTRLKQKIYCKWCKFLSKG